MTLGWGTPITPTSSPGLSSSLGSGGWGSPIAPAPSAAPAPSHGGGGWLGSITNPLGLRTALTQVVSGLGHTLGGAVVDVGEGIGSDVNALIDVAKGNTQQAGIESHDALR